MVKNSQSVLKCVFGHEMIDFGGEMNFCSRLTLGQLGQRLIKVYPFLDFTLIGQNWSSKHPIGVNLSNK